MGFGTWGGTECKVTSRPELVSELQQRFREEIKIVHGAADGFFGAFGGVAMLSYTFTFPRFDAALATLGRLEFGMTEEIPA
jgi:hypothetical protein